MAEPVPDEVARGRAARTVPAGFLATVRRQPQATALRWREADQWSAWTWREYAERVARVGGGLRERGVGPGDRVLLMMRNRPEFHVVDMAALMCGAIPVSIYNSSAPEQVAQLAAHCRAGTAVVESEALLDRVLSVRAELPGLRQVVSVGAGGGPGVEPWAALEAAHPLQLDAAAAALAVDDVATVIYTSGTTGPPKGVVLRHSNIWAQYLALLDHLGPDGAGKRLVSYLPMAHVAERMVTHYLHVLWGTEVSTCPDLARLPEFLTTVRPHLLFGPPRVWEKLHAGLHAVLAGDPARRGRVDAALPVGRRVGELRAHGQPLPAELAASWTALDEDCFAPLRAMVGLDACEVAFTGAAPIPVGVLQWFRDIGLPMSEIYGMSENTGGMTWDPHRVRVGTVGRAVTGTVVRTAADGEVLCRGPIVFSGYLDDPAGTAAALDAEGWLHTGDVGELDDDGYLRIVDRKKELIITAGGKNISPANLEAALKTIPLIGQAVAIGDGRAYVTALLVLDPEGAPAWARAAGLEGTDPGALASHPVLSAEVARQVGMVNRRLARVERVRRFALVGEEWLADSELLTPTMKLKRRGVHRRFAETIEGLYRGRGIAVEGPAAAGD